MEDLQRLGAKSVPVVSRGEKFVFAQVIRDVVEFLELDEDSSPELNPEELAERFQGILRISVNLVGSFPNNTLTNQLPNRSRSWKVLLHLSLIHISEPTRPRLISYAVFCLKKKI